MENKEITIYELMGLIEDDKAPEEIKIDNITLYFNKNYPSIERIYCNDLGTGWCDLFEIKLNTKVLISSEENNEWEDIEEIEVKNAGRGDYIVNEQGIKCGLGKHSKVIVDKVNKLIKNQKYLKERLDKNGFE